MATTPRWNHNLHHHPLILDALPQTCGRVLDVGCGEGDLVLDLSQRAAQVVGLDIDGPTIELARRRSSARNVQYVVGDLLLVDLEPASFDAVVSVAALHHMDATAALRRMAELLRPGGRLVVVGLARSRSPRDVAADAAGTVATRILARGRERWETSAPKIWPPPHTYGDVRRLAADLLPGSSFRRLVLFRYALTWAKPPAW